MTLRSRSSRPQSSQHRVSFAWYAFVCLASASPLLAFLLYPAFAKSKKTGDTGIHKIKHVIIIMQENRSFDSHFGTYPGAEEIPMKDGVTTVCNADPKNGGCIKPYDDSQGHFNNRKAYSPKRGQIHER